MSRFAGQIEYSRPLSETLEPRLLLSDPLLADPRLKAQDVFIATLWSEEVEEDPFAASNVANNSDLTVL